MAKPKLCKVCKKEFKPMQITPVCSYICALKLNQQKEAKKEAIKNKEIVEGAVLVTNQNLQIK